MDKKPQSLHIWHNTQMLVSIWKITQRLILPAHSLILPLPWTMSYTGVYVAFRNCLLSHTSRRAPGFLRGGGLKSGEEGRNMKGVSGPPQLFLEMHNQAWGAPQKLAPCVIAGSLSGKSLLQSPSIWQRVGIAASLEEMCSWSHRVPTHRLAACWRAACALCLTPKCTQIGGGGKSPLLLICYSSPFAAADTDTILALIWLWKWENGRAFIKNNMPPRR